MPRLLCKALPSARITIAPFFLGMSFRSLFQGACLVGKSCCMWSQGSLSGGLEVWVGYTRKTCNVSLSLRLSQRRGRWPLTWKLEEDKPHLMEDRTFWYSPGCELSVHRNQWVPTVLGVWEAIRYGVDWVGGGLESGHHSAQGCLGFYIFKRSWKSRFFHDLTQSGDFGN